MKRFVAFMSFMLITACAPTPTLQGKWVLNGPTPRPSLISSNLLALEFENGRSVTMTYTPAVPMFAPIAASAGADESKYLKPQRQTYPYDDLGHGEIRVVMGSQAQNFRVEIKSGLLYFTPVAASSGNSQADALIAASQPTTVFRRGQ